MSWLFFFIYNCSGVGRLYTKYTKYHVIINPSGIGAGTDRVLSYFFFPGRDRDLERDLSEASFCNYLLSSFFFLFSSKLLSTCIYSFSILLYTGIDVCSNCILGPTVVNSGSALTPISDLEVFKTMTRNAIPQDSSLTTMSAISERPLHSSAKTWNTDRLGARLGVDVASAATAGALTCPVITVIDR